MNPDLLDRLVVAATGPFVAVVVGTLIVGSTVNWATRRGQERHARYELRHELLSQMTLSANELYFAAIHYRRAKVDRLGGDLSAEQMAPILHEQYRKTKAMGRVIESRLEAYFASDEPRALWHAVLDLLAGQYDELINEADENLLMSNAGEAHSRLSVGELRQVDIDATIRQAVRNANLAVLRTPLDLRTR